MTSNAAPARAATYRRICTVAAGGMGYVELVMRDEGHFKRLHARKRLHLQYRSDPSFRNMFVDEARLAGLMRHPNVVSVIDIGEDDEGPFLIMDYVEGVPTSKVFEECGETKNRLPVQIATRIALEAARAAHVAGTGRGRFLRSPS